VITDTKEFNEKLHALTQTTEHEEEIQKMLRDVTQKGQHFITRAKFKIFDVLTDEQMEKLQNLIDNPPDYVKTIIAEIKKLRGENTDSMPVYLKSWKPGEPIPEEYKKHRASRKMFPAEEK
ncbi:MAG: hypothetical protein LBC20_12950, partial [Planctomycetaceae bacterium]|nr:hypothetical protein [Planctomycetaceae bacterium]